MNRLTKTPKPGKSKNMSICRKDRGEGVYMFEHVDGYISCFEISQFDGGQSDANCQKERRFNTFSDARAHASNEHRNAGHEPCPSDDYFRIAIETEGDDVKSAMEESDRKHNLFMKKISHKPMPKVSPLQQQQTHRPDHRHHQSRGHRHRRGDVRQAVR